MTATADLTYDATSRRLDGPEPLHYHVAGTGPGLLLLHGSGPGVTGWANFGENLPVFGEHFTTVVPDQPGYGASLVPALDRPYAEVSVAALLRLLDDLGLERVHVLGNSLGGMVATQLALDHPDRVDRLVLMGPGGVGVPLFTPQPTEGIRLLVQFLEDPTRERLVAWMRCMVGDPAFLTEERIEARWRTASAPGALDFTRDFYRAAMRAMASGAAPGVPIWARLGELTHPTLLTYGRDDRVTPLEGAFLPLRHIADAELHVFPKCGHWAMQERKDDFERVVLEFLTR
ncbi:alpha/beta fold hydrolase [Pseudonocardia nigra]|uniref:alpha/beta fold hydrolase n=1 Tax=Pseudonocardia nigra TaxID=1921578 RepID=UPI001C606346|nr:alpha/beta hydrolase [Pseudonocardia nigra]